MTATEARCLSANYPLQPRESMVQAMLEKYYGSISYAATHGRWCVYHEDVGKVRNVSPQEMDEVFRRLRAPTPDGKPPYEVDDERVSWFPPEKKGG